ncbi:MAG: YceI family protein [Actinomycetota bacterium]|nr:YceI family protein [Actinomycetota bacterium]
MGCASARDRGTSGCPSGGEVTRSAVRGTTASRTPARRWALDSELTIGEITRPLTLDVEFGGVAEFFDGTRHTSFEANGEISRKEFGLGSGHPARCWATP